MNLASVALAISLSVLSPVTDTLDEVQGIIAPKEPTPREEAVGGAEPAPQPTPQQAPQAREPAPQQAPQQAPAAVSSGPSGQVPSPSEDATVEFTESEAPESTEAEPDIVRYPYIVLAVTLLIIVATLLFFTIGRRGGREAERLRIVKKLSGTIGPRRAEELTDEKE